MTLDIADQGDLSARAEAAKGEGDLETAADLFNQAGNAHMREGRVAEALAAYEAALACVPDFPRALGNMGVAHAQLGQLEDAIIWFQKAFDRECTQTSLRNLVRTLRTMGRVQELMAPMLKYIEHYPDDTGTMMDTAMTLSSLGQHEAAITCYRRVLEADPENAMVYNHLAAEFKNLFQFETALEHVDRAEALKRKQTGTVDPSMPANRAFILLRWHKPDQAFAVLEEARKQFPDDTDLLAALGNALMSLKRWEEAEAVFEQLKASGARIHPSNDAAYAETLFILGKTDRAMEVYEQLIKNNPELLAVRYSHALRLLMLGRFREGWAEYRYRWLHASEHDLKRTFPQPIYNGEAPGTLNGKLLVITEQGHGDTLQFSRYIPMLAEKGYEVLFEVHYSLLLLFTQSFPDSRIKIIPNIDIPDRIYQDLPFAAYVSLMNLPRHFATTLETIPAQPYLTVPPYQQDYWANRLAEMLDEPESPRSMRVGLVWAGDSRPYDPAAHQVDNERSFPLSVYAPLAKIPGIAWISLQKGEPASQLEDPPPGLDIYDPMNEVEDFADTAAIVKNLDLVISVDTSMVHLTGGLGVPVWILSRFDGCWRWLLDREDSPWYPSARLFRQDRDRDWSKVIEKVAAALEEVVARHAAGFAPGGKRL